MENAANLDYTECSLPPTPCESEASTQMELSLPEDSDVKMRGRSESPGASVQSSQSHLGGVRKADEVVEKRKPTVTRKYGRKVKRVIRDSESSDDDNTTGLPVVAVTEIVGIVANKTVGKLHRKR